MFACSVCCHTVKNVYLLYRNITTERKVDAQKCCAALYEENFEFQIVI